MGFLSALFGDKPGSKLAAYKKDHAVPERRLVHGFLAFYTGNDGDPRYTVDQRTNLDHLVQGWGLDGPSDLYALMDRYQGPGECNLAFDLIRVIKLARHGAGAGWLSEEESWQRCFDCAQRLKRHYARWEDVYVDFQAGRDTWWRKCMGKAAPADEYKNYAQRYAEANALILSKLPLHA